MLIDLLFYGFLSCVGPLPLKTGNLSPTIINSSLTTSYVLSFKYFKTIAIHIKKNNIISGMPFILIPIYIKERCKFGDAVNFYSAEVHFVKFFCCV